VRLAVSLGSERSADDLTHAWIGRELEWLRTADRSGTSILGLCFGGQALAVALGGGVARASLPERGWVTVSTCCPELISAGPWLAWHDDVIELPPRAQLLAHNDSGPQAFRVGRHLGLQFHPEATAQILHDWIETSRNGEVDGAAVLSQAKYEFPRAAADAHRLFTGFASSVRNGRW
jgi:GMP synthase-like glutamine amidotransferase